MFFLLHSFHVHVYAYCAASLWCIFCSFYICMFECILCTLFYVMPLGVINDDDDDDDRHGIHKTIAQTQVGLTSKCYLSKSLAVHKTNYRQTLQQPARGVAIWLSRHTAFTSRCPPTALRHQTINVVIQATFMTTTFLARDSNG